MRTGRRWTTKNSRSRTYAAISSLSLLAIMLIVGVEPSAKAQVIPDNNCHTQVNEQGQETSPTTFKGIQATVAVAAWTGDCIRVSSLAITKNDNPADFVELGWSLGYHFRDNGTCCDYATVPLLFEAWTPPLSQETEHNISGVTGSSVLLAIQDSNQDATWNALKAGATVGVSMTVDFSRGNPITNSERHSTCKPANSTPQNPCDSAWAHFSSLKKWKVTDAGFTAWNSQAHGPANDDPWYWWDYTSATESYVRLCSASGCAGD